MISFWTSVDKLTNEGFKLAWFGVCISLVAWFAPDARWLSLCGLGTTAIGIVLGHRRERLKKLDAEPRWLTPEQRKTLLVNLQRVPKAPAKVQYSGHDAEAKAFAAQIKEVFVEAGLLVEQFCGAIVFDPCDGMSIILCEWDTNNQTAFGIQNAWKLAGVNIEIKNLMKDKVSSIEFAVFKKPSRQTD